MYIIVVRNILRFLRGPWIFNFGLHHMDFLHSAGMVMLLVIPPSRNDQLHRVGYVSMFRFQAMGRDHNRS